MAVGQRFGEIARGRRKLALTGGGARVTLHAVISVTHGGYPMNRVKYVAYSIGLFAIALTLSGCFGHGHLGA